MLRLKEQQGNICRQTKRPLGKILIDGAFISQNDLECALEEQRHTNELLGEVLVRMGVLDQTDLKAALSVQTELASLENAVRTASGVRQMLGDLLLRARHITQQQLDQALEEQKRTGEKLGEILVHRGLIISNELDAVLAFQQSQSSDKPYNASFRLGEILIAANYISREQLQYALEKQKHTQKRLGEVLVEAGYVQPHQIDQGLKLQHKLVTAALVAVLSLSSMPDVYASSQAVNTSGEVKVTVTATVLARATLKILYQAPELVVTNADIIRGYVEVKGASHIAVKNNNRAGYLLAFEGLSRPFKEVYVNGGMGAEVQISSGGGWIHQPYTQGPVPMELSYRFVLAENAQPGTYAWPLSLSASPL
jgi:hypothetical protein